LNNEFEVNGLESLVNELKRSDPEYLATVDSKNPQRVIRALEVCRFTGKSFTSFRKRKTKKRPFKIIKIGLQREREQLYDRIDLRVDKMIKNGLFNEVELLEEFRTHNALNTVGYKEIFEYIDGHYNKEEAIRLLKRNTRRYAKRQMTWFRRYDDVQWFNADNVKEVEKFILEQMEKIK
jgi:tRNA dimethylallyltransferase